MSGNHRDVTARRHVLLVAAVTLVVAALAVAWSWRGTQADTDASEAVQLRPAPGASVTPGEPGAPQASASPDPDDADEPAQPTQTEASATTPPADLDPLPPQERTVAEPVAFDEPATPAAGVAAKITAIEDVQGEATLPGEVAGPGLRVTVTLSNDTRETLDLRGVVCNVYLGKALDPALALLEPGGAPFPEELAAGGEAEGIFVFRVPKDARDRVRLELDVSPTSTIVLFEGRAVARG